MDEKLERKPGFAGKSLTDTDISSQRRMTRRSILGSLGLGLGVAALAVVGRPATGIAQGPGCTDNDGGQSGDPPGGGRRCQSQQGRCSDFDGGPSGDPPGQGRRCRPRAGGCTDNDGGPSGDPPGQGRRCRPGSQPSRPSGCTDMDSGPNEDQPGSGVRCSFWI
jgi:hypothetical protein